MSRANDAELHTDDYVAMSISSEPLTAGKAAAKELSRLRYRKLVRTHAETSPGAAVMAADLSGEKPLVGVG